MWCLGLFQNYLVGCGGGRNEWDYRWNKIGHGSVIVKDRWWVNEVHWTRLLLCFIFSIIKSKNKKDYIVLIWLNTLQLKLKYPLLIVKIFKKFFWIFSFTVNIFYLLHVNTCKRTNELTLHQVKQSNECSNEYNFSSY